MSDQRAFNVDPYYDDFNGNKDFHQIMFKPGTSVQSRELTQLQTILRDQIKKFGDHVFQQGSVVIPGNSFFELAVPCVKLQNNFGLTAINVNQFLNQTVVGATTGVEAIVRAVEPLTSDDPNTIFVNYTSAGPDGESLFQESEEIYVKSNISIRAVVQPTDAVSNGSLAYVNEGVYYVNGSFVKVKKQSVVMTKYSTAPNCHVLLKIDESIVTSDDDQSLLDPAQGSYNYAAPGADRLKISLTLVTLPLGSELTDDYVEIIRFKDGVLQFHSKTPKYSELEKSLARRTYDESGDYVVNGLKPSIEEHIRLAKTKGRFPPPYGDRNKFVVTLEAGKAYIQGFEKETITETVLEIDKARTLDSIKNKESNVIAAYGQVIYVSDMIKLPNFYTHETILFYNDNDPNEGSAVNVGSAKAFAMEYTAGQGIYSMFVYDVKFTGSYNIEDVGGLRFSGSGSATVLQKASVPNATGEFTAGELVTFSTRSATVKYHNPANSELFFFKHNSAAEVPVVGDNIVGGTSTFTGLIRDKEVIEARGSYESPIIPVPLAPLASVRDENGDSDITYRVYKYLEINTDGNGDGSVTVDVGRIDALTQSTVVASWSGGLLDISLFDLEATGTTLTIEGGPVNSNIKIQATVTKIGASEKTKTLTTKVDAGLTLQGTGQQYAQLVKADVYDLISVVSSVDGDVTNRFKIDNGQRNYFYDLGRVNLNGVAPTGTLTVTYRYFEHSMTGDYFTVDSYRNSGIANPTDLDFISNIPEYYSTTSSKYYDLKKYYDFRKIIGQSGDAPVNGSRITASVDYYVGRIDMYGMDKGGSIVYVRGIPEEVPTAPKFPTDALLLGSFEIPAWTENIRTIYIQEEKVRRFTMKDINRLSDRVGNLENYATLNQQESSLVNSDIVDAKTGLNRFKLGFLVDDFSNLNLISDRFSPYFAAEYDSKLLFPAREWCQSDLYMNTPQSTNYQVTGDVVTLPYTEVVFIGQNLSTKITNVNPFLVIAWVGNMKIEPELDSWVESENLPTIFNTIDQVVTVTRQEIVMVPVIYFGPPGTPAPAPVPAPPPVPAPSPPVIIKSTSVVSTNNPTTTVASNTNFTSTSRSDEDGRYWS